MKNKTYIKVEELKHLDIPKIDRTFIPVFISDSLRLVTIKFERILDDVIEGTTKIEREYEVYPKTLYFKAIDLPTSHQYQYKLIEADTLDKLIEDMNYYSFYDWVPHGDIYGGVGRGTYRQILKRKVS